MKTIIRIVAASGLVGLGLHLLFGEAVWRAAARICAAALLLGGCAIETDAGDVDEYGCQVRPDLDAWCQDLGYDEGFECAAGTPMPTRAIEGDVYCRHAMPVADGRGLSVPAPEGDATLGPK